MKLLALLALVIGSSAFASVPDQPFCSVFGSNVYCGYNCVVLGSNVYCGTKPNETCSVFGGTVYCGINCAVLGSNVYCGDQGLARHPATPAQVAR